MNLARATRLVIERRDERAGGKHIVVAFIDRQGFNVYEGTQQHCREFIQTVGARMNAGLPHNPALAS